MRRSARDVFYGLISGVSVLLSTTLPVEAAFMMRLSSGGESIMVSDGSVDDITGVIPGLIAFSGDVGNFNINVTLGSSKPLIGSETNPMLNITSLNASSKLGGTLDIELSDTGFGPVGGPQVMFATDLNGTLVPGSISAWTYFNNGSQDFTTANLVGNVGPLTGNLSGSDSQVASPGSPFSMNMKVSITHDAIPSAPPWALITTAFDATSRATSVPEPSATLCLGMALFGMAGYVGWKRRKTTI